MPVTGAKPKEQKVHRNPPVYEWHEFPAIPFKGAPRLPGLKEFSPPTRRWWSGVSRMPHCVSWTETDWNYAMDTALVHERFINGSPATVNVAAAELRNREKQMGTTMDSRRDLRIRYVPVVEEQPPESEEGVMDFESERRRRLLEAAE